MVNLRKILDEKGIIWHDKSEDFKTNYIMWICRTHFEYNGFFYSVINGFGTHGGWSSLGDEECIKLIFGEER